VASVADPVAVAVMARLQAQALARPVGRRPVASVADPVAVAAMARLQAPARPVGRHPVASVADLVAVAVMARLQAQALARPVVRRPEVAVPVVVDAHLTLAAAPKAHLHN
jgi:hypothetical protein